MVITDKKLRQELISYGETVPPISQRNREQLRARLEFLQSQKQTRAATAASPSRHQSANSPLRTTRSTASPSYAHRTASPSHTTRSAASPLHSRSAASPTRMVQAAAASSSRAHPIGSPSRSAASRSPRTRSSGTRMIATTYSQQTPNLIELGGSETESSSVDVLRSRSLRSGQTTPNMQTRSIALHRQHDSPSSISSGPGNVTNDIELSSKLLFKTFELHLMT